MIEPKKVMKRYFQIACKRVEYANAQGRMFQ